LGILVGHVVQHRDQRRVVLQVLRDDLVVGVAVGVPGGAAVVPAQATGTVHRRLHALERGVVGAAGGRAAVAGHPDATRHRRRHGGEVTHQRIDSLDERAGADVHDAAGAVVLVEAGVHPRDDLGVVGDPGARAVEALLLASPVTDDDRAA